MSRIEEIKNFLKSLAPNELEQAHSIMSVLQQSHSIASDPQQSHSIASDPQQSHSADQRIQHTTIDLTDEDDSSSDSMKPQKKTKKRKITKEEAPRKKQKTEKKKTVNLKTLMEKMKQTRNNAPSYSKRAIQGAMKLTKKWRKNLPIITQNFFKESCTEVWQRPVFQKWEKQIVSDCKRYKGKYGKPFPCGFYDHCFLMNGEMEDDDGWGFDMCRNLESTDANEFRSANSGVFFSSRIAMHAYITMVIQRMEEVLNKKKCANFADMSSREKLSVLIEAFNDFDNAYCWAGPMRMNRFNKGYEMYYPFSWINNGPSDHDMGGTLLWRVEKHFKFDDRKITTMAKLYEDDEEKYEKCEPHRMVLLYK